MDEPDGVNGADGTDKADGVNGADGDEINAQKPDRADQGRVNIEEPGDSRNPGLENLRAEGERVAR